MSENPLHYMSDVPCKKCKGRTRYKTNRGCVPCQKAHTKRKRASVSAEFAGLLPTPAEMDAIHKALDAGGPKPGDFHPSVIDMNPHLVKFLDDGSDLL